MYGEIVIAARPYVISTGQPFVVHVCARNYGWVVVWHFACMVAYVLTPFICLGMCMCLFCDGTYICVT